MVRFSTRPQVWLAVVAVAYAVTHHIGVAAAGLGSIGETRWADWIDVLTPYAVLLPAALALHHGRVPVRVRALYLVGAITYVEGHGVHLAANSVGNVEPPSDIVHLWDEVVGHYLWYGGAALVFAALSAGLAGREAVHGVLPYTLAVLVGGTVATNALEGGTAVFSMVIAVAFMGWGWRTRAGLGRLLLVTYGIALGVLAGYGLWQRGFPQPSELGWI